MFANNLLVFNKKTRNITEIVKTNRQLYEMFANNLLVFNKKTRNIKKNSRNK